MNDNTNSKSSFISLIPNLIAGGTVFFFVLSFIYNYIYFYYLGIDVELVPLTFADYTVSAPLYITLILPFFIGLASYKFFPNQSNKTYKIKKIVSVFAILLLICSAVVLLCLIGYRLYEIYPFTKYTLNPMYVLLIFMILYVVDDFFNLFSPWAHLLFLVIYFALFFFSDIRNDINKKFQAENYFNENKNVILIRTFEKGMLVGDREYKISFRSFDSKNIIDFDYNEELADYLKTQTR